MKYRIRKRILSLVLCISMIIPLFVQILPVYSTEDSTVDDDVIDKLENNIGKQAIFDWWTDFLLADSDTLLNSTAEQMSDYYSANDYENWVLFDDIPANDLVLVIDDYHYDEENGYHWYKLTGTDLPDVLKEKPWVLYTLDQDIVNGVDPYLAIYDKKDTIRIMTVTVGSVDNVRFVISGPDAISDATISITDHEEEDYTVSSMAYIYSDNYAWHNAINIQITKADGTEWLPEDGNVGIRYTAEQIALNNFEDNVCYGGAFLYIDGIVYSATVTDKTGGAVSDIVYTNSGSSVIVFELLLESFEYIAKAGYFTNDGVVLYDNKLSSQSFLAAELPVTFTVGYSFTDENGQEWYWLEDEALIGSPYFLTTIDQVTIGALPEEFGAGRVSVIDEKGSPIDSISLPQYQKPIFNAVSSLSSLYSDVSYQWQLEYEENKWVDIYGEDSASVKLSYGMLASLLDSDGKVNVRCESTAGSKTAYSTVIPVTVEMYEYKEPDVVVSNSFTTSSGKNVTVTVAGNIPEDASVSLEETDSSGIETAENEKVIASLDISVKNADGTEWQPENGESVTVTIAASSLGLENGDEFVVYHLHNGEVKLLGSYVVENDTISFETDGFSKFVFALAAEETETELPDYSSEIEKHAVFNLESGYVDILDEEPTLDNIYNALVFDIEEFPSDIVFSIDAYKIVTETYDLTDETTGEVTGQAVIYNLWYQVSVVSGSMPADFENGYWIFQNDVTEGDDTSSDTLTLYTPEEVPSEPEVKITVDGEAVEEISVSTAQKVTLTAAPNVEGSTTYQWQILIASANMWVNVSGQTSAECTVNYGMVSNRLDSNGQAHVRCVTTVDGTEIISESIAVNITETAVAFYSPNILLSSSPAYSVMPLADEDSSTETQTKYNFIVKYYLRDTTEEIYQQFQAEFTPGENRTLQISIPEKVGYSAYWVDAETGEATLITDYSMEYTYTFNGTEDAVYEVRYMPNEINYVVKHYYQNIYDDEYAEPVTETLTGTADTLVGDVHKSTDGFYNIPYIHPTIAPDGSTVIEIYYDRYYYLMTFALGEDGYGVEPEYARYGTEITLGTPTRAGYSFNGWEYENGTDITTTTVTMPANDVNIVAKWTAGTASYTIVYWKENADPDKDADGNTIVDSNGDPVYSYSYWTHRVVTNSKPGEVVSGRDDVAAYVADEQYFTFNDARTDKNVIVKGNGSTVVNVYYTRNSYTIYFYGNGECTIPVHTHGTDCNSYMICGKSEHTHTDECGEPIIGCGVTEHTAHTADCIVCGEVEHTAHTSECLICTKPEYHSHTKECYGVAADASAWVDPDKKGYSNNLNQIGYGNNDPWTGRIGILQTRESSNDDWEDTDQKYIYINGSWYPYTGTADVGDRVNVTCGLTAGTHTHSEAAGCYSDTVHSHTESCYGDALHTHSDTCYIYSDCTSDAHTHTDACYSECTLIEHTHGNCPTKNQGKYNVIRVITAKYDADIYEEWPTADDFDGLAYWTGNGTDQSSRVVTMNKDWCKDGILELTANYDDTKYQLNYWFEDFDQDSTTTSATRVYYNGKYYVLSKKYTQIAYYGDTRTWGYKEITGMTATTNRDAERVTVDGVYTFNLYYNRNTYTLKFQNIDEAIYTEENVMFEKPLDYYLDDDGNYVSSIIPDYPDSLEDNAYEFAGWYTTPECFEGTEFDFATGTMPNGDLTLFAKWAPVTHTVNIYLDNTLTTQIGETQLVPHNDYAGKPANDPTNGNLEFLGWFYINEDGEEKAFSFATQIKRDMNVYAKWRDTSIFNYVINYIGIDSNGNEFQIASPTIGQQYADKTVTCEPKGTDEYFAEYQDDGYFAMTAAHSIVMGEDACQTGSANCSYDSETKTHTFTFYYELGPVVPYTVHYYYEKTTNKVFESETFEDNRKSVVVAYAKGKVGYKADAVQKSLVVIKGQTNEIIFYYSKDENATYYEVIHHLMGKDGKELTNHTFAYNANIGEVVEESSATVAPLDFDGFEFDPAYTGTLRTGTAATDPILQLHLYYVEKEVTLKYEVVGSETGGGTVNPGSESLGASYGAATGSTATPNKGYAFVGWYSKWECTEDQLLSTDLHYTPTKANTALWVNGTTYYAKFEELEVTINYVPIGPANAIDFGYVNPTTETVGVISGNPSSTATASGNVYKFVGWYSDEACTNRLSTNATYEPQKVDGLHVSATYYAKFEYNLTSLTVKKQGYDAVDKNQSFLFRLTDEDGLEVTVTIHGNGEVVIDGLTVGKKYKITETTAWSWRYASNGVVQNETTVLISDTKVTNGAEFTLNATGNVITFANTRSNPYWLDGDSWCNNIFN